MLVDVVTERTADFHRELLMALGVPDPGAGSALYGSAYRPVERDGSPALDIWREAVAVGQPLPTLPLWLRGGLCLPVELEATTRGRASSNASSPPRAPQFRLSCSVSVSVWFVVRASGLHPRSRRDACPTNGDITRFRAVKSVPRSRR